MSSDDDDDLPDLESVDSYEVSERSAAAVDRGTRQENLFPLVWYFLMVCGCRSYSLYGVIAGRFSITAS